MESTRTNEAIDATAEYERTTLAAAFADRDQAHDAIHRLHDEGFGDTWLGITKSEDTASYGTTTDETRVEADNWFMRFFGEGDESLHDALVRHGVASADAAKAGALAPNSAIVTVDGANHPELAAQIISECGGKLITQGFGSTGLGTTGSYAAPSPRSTPVATGATASATGMPYNVATEIPAMGGGPLGAIPSAMGEEQISKAPVIASDAATADYGSYRAGKTVDEDTRLQLREERLRIDKQRVSRGAATISKDVVTETQEVDVPLVREELFIQRRPASAAAVAAGPIGSETETFTVPLTEEKVNVTKVAVVTEEVVVGKRQVEEVEHVSETTRKEQLNVKDVDATSGTGTKLNDPLL